MAIHLLKSRPNRLQANFQNRLVIVLFLLLLGMVGIGLMGWVTPYGVGIYVDTLYYVTSAKNLLAGIGMGRLTGTGIYKPMTHYPPLYALVLAFTQLCRMDILDGARWISMFAFGLTVVLAGGLVWQRTRSAIFSLASACLVLGSGVLLRTYSWAMSEPVYIVLELFGFLFLAAYFSECRRGWLVAASLAISLAVLTRYVGFSLVAACSLALIANRTWKMIDRLRDCALFLTISLLPTAIWFIRNQLVSGTLTNRMISFHPITEEKFASLQKAVLSWGLIPQRLVVGRELLAFYFIVVVLIIVSLIWLARLLPREGGTPSLEFILILSSWAYIGLLAVSLNWIDSTTPLDNRLLMPLYLNILLLLGIAMALLWKRGGVLPCLVAAGLLFWFGYYTVTRLDGAILDLRRDGQDYASLRWKNSPTIQFVRQQAPPLIYTNDITAIYFLVGQDSVGIPNFRSEAAEFETMRNNLRASGGFLVLFGELTGEFAPLEEITHGMTLVARFDDGAVYKISP